MTMAADHRPVRPPLDRIELDGTVNRALKTGRHRLLLAGVLFVVAYTVIAVRLVDLTIVKEGFEPRFASAAATVHHAQVARRDIVDRNGVVLAINLPTASLYADPKLVLDADEAAAKLAGVLPEVSREELLTKLKSKRRFVWLKRDLTPKQQATINRLGLPGIAFQREDRRIYPLGRDFAHVVGYVDIDNRGIAGVEASFDDVLRTPRVTPEPLRLSFDSRFQYVLREELARGMATFKALGASGLILDVASGEVLAMVSLPDFDPNNPRSRTGEAIFNRSTLGVYEMGSTFKIFTTAMALDSGKVTLRDGYDASKPLRMARFVVRDYSPKKRWLSIPEIFVYSSNIGTAKMALDFGTERQQAFLSRLGLLRPSSIELNEVAMPLTPSPWREINTMTIGYGHGVAVSPLQLGAAVSAIVNGGLFHPPTLLRRQPQDPLLGWRVIAKQTSDHMRGLMHLVTIKGTGRKAQVPGYLIGGKTGTAEKPGTNGYRRKALISSFVAAFPIEAPRFVVLALYDEPKGNADTHNYATAGWTAAPTVGRIIARIGPMAGVAARAESADLPEAAGLLVPVSSKEEPGVAF